MLSVTMLVLAVVGLIAFFPAIFLMAFLLLSPQGYAGIVMLIIAQIVLSIAVFAVALVAQRLAKRRGEKVSTATAAVIVSAIGMSFNLLLGAIAMLGYLG